MSPKGPVFLWHFLNADHVFLLAKQLATLIKHDEELETHVVRQCYEIIVRLTRHYKVKDKTAAVYTQWVLQSNPEELQAVHVIFSYLVMHDANYQLGCGAGGAGHLSKVGSSTL